jgi:hypothetical protein
VLASTMVLSASDGRIPGYILSSFIFSFYCSRSSNVLLYIIDVTLGDVRLALTELEDSLQGTFFRDYSLDLKILNFLLEDVSFDWHGLMRDAITPALLITPHLLSGPISRRCEKKLRIYQDVSFLLYQCELEIHKIRKHLEAARPRYFQQLSSCVILRSMGVNGGPARLLVKDTEERRLSVEDFSKYLSGLLSTLRFIRVKP